MQKVIFYRMILEKNCFCIDSETNRLEIAVNRPLLERKFH